MQQMVNDAQTAQNSADWRIFNYVYQYYDLSAAYYRMVYGNFPCPEQVSKELN